MNQKNLLNIIHKISFDRRNRHDLFFTFPEIEQAEILIHLTKHIQAELLSKISDQKIVHIIEHLDPNEVTDIIRILPKSRQTKILRRFNDELKANIEFLNLFDPKTAAGIMNTDYILIDIDDSFLSVRKEVKLHESRIGRLPSIIIIKNGLVHGYLPGHILGFVRPEERIKKHLRKIQTIKHNERHENVIELFRHNVHNKIVVIGEREQVIGIIYADDILPLLKEQASMALYDFAGVRNEEQVTDEARQKVQHRYKWLLLNLCTGFLAASTVKLFDETISRYVILAVYMPIVAGMGGNAGTQTLAILVRGITLKQITLQTALPVLKKEVTAGFINGSIIGISVTCLIFILHQNILIALILGVAMIINLSVATFFGTLIPLIMHRLGKDPATSATIFITTATDVLGFLAFLGLATLILP